MFRTETKDDVAHHPRLSREEWREHRRRRFRRHGRRAYIRSVYFLPSLCTLGNAVCGFAAIYIAGLDPAKPVTADQFTRYLADHRFAAAAYFIFFAMVFDALDGRLARFARHTTDFGGQLDSLADVISFGVAPAFIALQVCRSIPNFSSIPITVSRLIWICGAVYMSCAAVRLARFNVSNEHGEQHHFSFLGLPSPGAGGAVAAFILLQHDILLHGQEYASRFLLGLAHGLAWALPALVLATGLLMISNIRYAHLVNRYLRGKRSPARLIAFLAVILLTVLFHRYMLAAATLVYAASGPTSYAYARLRHRSPAVPVPAPPPANP